MRFKGDFKGIKNKVRRYLAIVLAAAMLVTTFGTMPVLGTDEAENFAEGTTDSSYSEYAEETTGDMSASAPGTASDEESDNGADDAQDTETVSQPSAAASESEVSQSEASSEVQGEKIEGENQSEKSSETAETSEIVEAEEEDYSEAAPKQTAEEKAEPEAADKKADADENKEKTESEEELSPEDEVVLASSEGAIEEENTDSDENAPQLKEGVYQLADADDLAWFRDRVNAGHTTISAVLTDDIDLNPSIINLLVKNKWEPVGTEENPFQGTFDGDYHIIDGLYINTESDCQGLFGVVKNCVVKNLIVKGTVSGGSCTGAVAGKVIDDTKVDDTDFSCIASYVSVSGNDKVGGIIGMLTRSAKSVICISECANYGDVEASADNSYAAGILGKVENTGKVSTQARLNRTVLDKCYNTGVVAGCNYLGGLLGGNYNEKNNKASVEIIGCYSAGKIESSFKGELTAKKTGAYAGDTQNAASSEGNYFCYEKTGVKAGTSGTSLSEQELRSSILTKTLDTTAYADNCGSFPVLAWESNYMTPASHDMEDTAASPSCLKAGTLTKVCKKCGASFSEEDPSAPATGHVFGTDCHCIKCGSCRIFNLSFSCENAYGQKTSCTEPDGSDAATAIHDTDLVAELRSDGSGRYRFTDRISVTIGGESFTDFSYTKQTDTDNTEIITITIPGDKITGDVIIGAAAEPAVYTVSFFDEGSSIYSTMSVPYGTIFSCDKTTLAVTNDANDTVVSPLAIESDDAYDRSFAGWDARTNSGSYLIGGRTYKVISDTVLAPIIHNEPKVYSVTVSSDDETVTAAGVTSCKYDTDLIIPVTYAGVYDFSQIAVSVMRRDTYLQSGTDYVMDRESCSLRIYGESLTGNITVKFTVFYRYYNVGFYDRDGALITGKTYAFRQMLPVTTPDAVDAALEKTYTDGGSTYTFAGWALSSEGEIVDFPEQLNGKVSYYAVYNSSTGTHTVRFHDYDGSVLNGDTTYAHRTELTEPEATREWSDSEYTYTFKGWTEDPAGITSGGICCTLQDKVLRDADYYPVYNKGVRTYPVEIIAENLTSYGAVTAAADEDYVVTFRGDRYYTQPVDKDDITVTLGGVASDKFTYNPEAGKLTIKAKYISELRKVDNPDERKVQIAVTGIHRMFNVEVNLVGMTVSDAAVQAEAGTTYKAYFNPDADRYINTNISVIINGQPAVKNVDYTYDWSTEKAAESQISGAAVTGAALSTEGALTSGAVTDDSSTESAIVTQKVKYTELTIFGDSIDGDISIYLYAQKKNTEEAEDNLILSSREITEGGVYYVSNSTDAFVDVKTSEHVTIKGVGMTPAAKNIDKDGAAEAITINYLVEGADLELDNVAFTNRYTDNFINFKGRGNKLTLTGNNYVFEQNTGAGRGAAIHAGSGTELTLQGTGTLLFGTTCYGAGIGGDIYEGCGEISIESGTYLGYMGPASAPGSIIGSGYIIEGVKAGGGSLTVNGGSLCLFENSYGVIRDNSSVVVLGDTNKFFSLRVNGGDINLSLNTNSENESLKGYIGISQAVIDGGSVRFFRIWDEKQRYYWEVTGIDRLVNVVNSAGEKLYCLYADLTDCPPNSDGTYTVYSDGELILDSYLHRYVTLGENTVPGETKKADDTRLTYSLSYESFPENEAKKAFLYETPENHILTGESFTKGYCWDSQAKEFSTDDIYPVIDGSDEIDFNMSVETAREGTTVTVSAIENNDYIVNRIGYRYGESGNICWSEAGTSAVSFVMPAEAVTIVSDTDETAFHGISINDAEHGSISVARCEKSDGTVRDSVTNAKKGDKVYISFSAESGYAPEKVWFNCAFMTNYAGSAVRNKENLYYFVMPDDDVTVSAAFMEAEKINLDSTTGGGVVCYEAPAGSTALLDITPVEDWGVAAVTVSAIETGAEITCTAEQESRYGAGTWSFEMPQGGVNVSVAFGKMHKVNMAEKNQPSGSSTVSYIDWEDAAPAGAPVVVTGYAIEPDYCFDQETMIAEYTVDDGTGTSSACAIRMKKIDESYGDRGWNLSYKGESRYADGAYTRETYTFLMPDADVTVSGDMITYKVIPYITGAEYGNCQIYQTGHSDNIQYARPGVEFSIYMRPEDECTASVPYVWYVDSEGQQKVLNYKYSSELTDGVQYSYTMPAADVHVEAEFSLLNARSLTFEKKGNSQGLIMKVDSVYSGKTGNLRDNNTIAKKGDLVYISAKCTQGYQLMDLYYTYPSDYTSEEAIVIEEGEEKTVEKRTLVRHELDVSLNESNLYCFRMPDDDVTIHGEATQKTKITIKYRVGQGHAELPIKDGETDCWALPGSVVTATGAGINGLRFAGFRYNYVSSNAIYTSDGAIEKVITEKAVEYFHSRPVVVEDGKGHSETIYVCDIPVAEDDMELTVLYLPVHQVVQSGKTYNGQVISEYSDGVEGQHMIVTPAAVDSEFYDVEHVYYISATAFISSGAVTGSTSGGAAEAETTEAAVTGPALSDLAKMEYPTAAAVEISPDALGIYSFDMPDDDVILYAIFKSKTDDHIGTISIKDDEDVEIEAAAEPFDLNGGGKVSLSTKKAAAGEYVYVTVTPDDDSYTGYGAVRYFYEAYGQQTSAAAINEEEEGWCTYDGTSDSYTYYFEMPDVTHVDVTVRFTSKTVWDGITADISWYDPKDSDFEIYTPAQLMGVAALVNGLYNEEINYIIGDSSYIKVIEGDKNDTDEADENNQNLVTADTYFLGDVDFGGCYISIKNDLDMGGIEKTSAKSRSGWTGARYMPIGGQYMMYYTDYDNHDTDGLSHLSSAFNGFLDGCGHTISNVHCDRYVSGDNYGDSQAVGLVGRLGSHDRSDETTPPDNPGIRNIVLDSGVIWGRRCVGGIVGKVGQTSASAEENGMVGAIIENCINKAHIWGTDKKGTGGIAGSSCGTGYLKNCANFGLVENTLADGGLAGGIAGSNDLILMGCYNVGDVESDSDDMAMGLGTSSEKKNTCSNSYILEDSAPGGDYYSVAAADKFENELSASDMKSEDFVKKLNCSGSVWVKDSSINGGYPALWYQDDPEGAFTRETVTIQQPTSGGSIKAYTIYNGESALDDGANTIENGQSIKMTAEPEEGMVLDYYTLNGEKVSGNIIHCVDGGVVSAVFRQLTEVKLYLPEDITGHESTRGFKSPVYWCSMTKEGMGPAEDGTLEVKPAGTSLNVPEDQELPSENGRYYITVYEGDKISVKTGIWDTAEPDKSGRTYSRAVPKYTQYYTTGKTYISTYTSDMPVLSGVEKIEMDMSLGCVADCWEQMADVSWYNTTDTTFEIASPEQLAGLAVIVNGRISQSGITVDTYIEQDDFAGKTINLTADCSLKKPDGTDDICPWTCIGSQATNKNSTFAGTFNGNGHTVSDLEYFIYCSNAGALFGHVTGTVKDLIVSGNIKDPGNNSEIKGLAIIAAAHNAGIAAYLEGGTINGCTSDVDIYSVKESSVSADPTGTGGIVANIIEGTVTGCTNNGNITGSTKNHGGIAGVIYADKKEVTIEVSDCTNTGKIEGNNNAGGILGLMIGEKSSVNCINCVNKGEVSLTEHYGGGIAGYIKGKAELSSCTNEGYVHGYSTSEYIAGIAGKVDGTSTISSCKSAGEIYGYNDVAGIAGYVNGNLSNCENSGKVTGEGTCVAGVAALSLGESASISGCKNSGEVTGKNVNKESESFTAGIVANASSGTTITGCTNSGEVTGNGNLVGGIAAGAIANGGVVATIKSCTNEASGSVTSTGSDTGGILGGIYSNTTSIHPNNTLICSGCTNKGKVFASGNNLGGIIGHTIDGIDCSGCSNAGEVTGNTSINCVGGVVGLIECTTVNDGYNPVFKGCFNSGTVTGYNDVGGVAGKISGQAQTYVSLNQCTNKDGGDVSGEENVGGVVGTISGGRTDILSCINNGAVEGLINAGGSVGYIYIKTDWYTMTYKIKNTYNNGTVTGGEAAGGSIGHIHMEAAQTGTTVTVNADACWNTGAVKANIYAGGVIGEISQKGDVLARNKNMALNITCSGNESTGTVTSSGNYAGGFSGYLSVNKMTAKECANRGNVTAKGSYAGGLAGFLGGFEGGSSATIQECVNDSTGSVTAGASYAGGIVGWIAGGTITSCVNYATVKASNYAGGVAGCIAGDGTVKCCGIENTAYVDCAGIAGSVAGKSESDIIGCYNRGKVSGNGGIAGELAGDARLSFCYSNNPDTNGLIEGGSGVSNAYATTGNGTDESIGVYYGNDYEIAKMQEIGFAELVNGTAGDDDETSFVALQSTFNNNLPVLRWETFTYTITVYDEYEGNEIAEETVTRGESYEISKLSKLVPETPESAVDGYEYEFRGWRCDGHLYHNGDSIDNITSNKRIWAEFKLVKIDEKEEDEEPAEDPGEGGEGDNPDSESDTPSDNDNPGQGDSGSGDKSGNSSGRSSGSSSGSTGNTSETGTGDGTGGGNGSGTESGAGGGGNGTDGSADSTSSSDSPSSEAEEISTGDTREDGEVVNAATVTMTEVATPTVEEMQETVANMNAYYIEAAAEAKPASVVDHTMMIILRVVLSGLLLAGIAAKLIKFYGIDMAFNRKKKKKTANDR